jgi:hypothetical protein
VAIGTCESGRGRIARCGNCAGVLSAESCAGTRSAARCRSQNCASGLGRERALPELWRHSRARPTQPVWPMSSFFHAGSNVLCMLERQHEAAGGATSCFERVTALGWRQCSVRNVGIAEEADSNECWHHPLQLVFTKSAVRREADARRWSASGHAEVARAVFDRLPDECPVRQSRDELNRARAQPGAPGAEPTYS